MRSLITLFSRALLVVGFAAGLAHAGQTLDVKVDGMSCAACASKLKTQVTAIDGVEDCDVSVAQGTAKVVVADDADLLAVAGQLEGAVNAAGLSLAR